MRGKLKIQLWLIVKNYISARFSPVKEALSNFSIVTTFLKLGNQYVLWTGQLVKNYCRLPIKNERIKWSIYFIYRQKWRVWVIKLLSLPKSGLSLIKSNTQVLTLFCYKSCIYPNFLAMINHFNYFVLFWCVETGFLYPRLVWNSLYSSGWPWTHGNPPAPTSQVQA